MTTGFGPGDGATWGPYTGHPNDPRDEGDDPLVDELLAGDYNPAAPFWIAKAIQDAPEEFWRAVALEMDEGRGGTIGKLIRSLTEKCCEERAIECAAEIRAKESGGVR